MNSRVAEHTLFLQAQLRSFNKEIITLKGHQELSRTSPLSLQKPYLDGKGLLRVGGRLHHGHLTFSQRHPIILATRDKLTRLLVEYHHLLSCIAGSSLLISILCRDYHILSCRRAVRSVCRQCVTCQHHNARLCQQVMGQLPKSRVTPGTVFSVTGTDFAGPITIKRGKP